jgi:hypothetical protein
MKSLETFHLRSRVHCHMDLRPFPSLILVRHCLPIISLEKQQYLSIDRDGTIDIIFPSCSSVSAYSGAGTDCYINIVYNQQLPLCTSRASSALGNESRTCREPDNLCSADPGFKFDLLNSPNNKVDAPDLCDLNRLSNAVVGRASHDSQWPLFFRLPLVLMLFLFSTRLSLRPFQSH